MSSITQREYWLDKVEAEIVAKTPQITDADRKQSISRLGLTSLLAKKEKLDNQHRDLETEIRKVEEDICRALDIPTGMLGAIRQDRQCDSEGFATAPQAGRSSRGTLCLAKQGHAGKQAC